MLKYILIIATFTALQGGIGDSQISFMGEVRGSAFMPDVTGFSKIYGGGRQVVPVVALGVGFGDVYLVGRYHKFEAAGESIVDGIDLTGRAEWSEELISIGLRTYESAPFYYELAYVIGVVEESITTDQPEYTALNHNFNAEDNRGGSFTIGINFKLVTGVYLTGEAQYIYVPYEFDARLNRDKVNFGGTSFAVGLSLVL